MGVEMTVNDLCFLVFIAGIVFIAAFAIYMRMPPETGKQVSFWCLVACCVAAGVAVAWVELSALRLICR
jgi:hypothetical protein